VSLPAREELPAAAGRITVAGQFRPLAEWLGPQGRALTTAKNIRPADARELVTLLGTGEKGLKFRSAAEVPGLNLMLTWALVSLPLNCPARARDGLSLGSTTGWPQVRLPKV
jgi:hypothetical protein